MSCRARARSEAGPTPPHGLLRSRTLARCTTARQRVSRPVARCETTSVADPAPAYHPRRATAVDAARVAAIYLAAVHTSLPWLRLAHTDQQCRDWIAGHVVPDQQTWVVEVDGKVAAMLVLEPPAHAGEPAWIGHLYVHPDHQGRGAGDRLVRYAKERNPDGLQLWTFQRNQRARAFYEHRGFVAVEFTDGSGNEENEPDVRYVWSASV